MNKEELEEKIKNNESVWCYYVAEHRIARLNDSYDFKRYKIFDKDLIFGNDEYYYPLKYLFSTKAQAQHCLDNSNVKRTEKLPYITWEEFKEKDNFTFCGAKHNEYYFFTRYDITNKPHRIIIEARCGYRTIRAFDYTEENFYKAYEVAKDLFLGGKNE